MFTAPSSSGIYLHYAGHEKAGLETLTQLIREATSLSTLADTEAHARTYLCVTRESENKYKSDVPALIEDAARLFDELAARNAPKAQTTSKTQPTSADTQEKSGDKGTEPSTKATRGREDTSTHEATPDSRGHTANKAQASHQLGAALTLALAHTLKRRV
ncbi:hypothetical protein ERJ75_000781300 [Trypanosoma vivax]|nr:hypothetical protein ERJ75_000781300 [Trypanosoma vivax]